jgi:hypothetical protein
MSETANIQENVTAYLNSIIMHAQFLGKHLKPVKWHEIDEGRRLIVNIIILANCAKYLSHMSTGNLEEIVANVLEYFKTGLYDTNKTTGTTRDHNSSFIVRAWVYTPDTHNDAGEWYHIYTFDNFFDADECITMLKEIEAELKRVD